MPAAGPWWSGSIFTFKKPVKSAGPQALHHRPTRIMTGCFPLPVHLHHTGCLCNISWLRYEGNSTVEWRPPHAWLRQTDHHSSRQLCRRKVDNRVPVPSPRPLVVKNGSKYTLESFRRDPAAIVAHNQANDLPGRIIDEFSSAISHRSITPFFRFRHDGIQGH